MVGSLWLYEKVSFVNALCVCCVRRLHAALCEASKPQVGVWKAAGRQRPTSFSPVSDQSSPHSQFSSIYFFMSFLLSISRFLKLPVPLEF
jgi:hypothetical protein